MSQTPPLVLDLNIQEAVQRALDRNPDVLNSREKLNQVEQSISYAVSQFLPNLTGMGSAFKEKAAVNGISVPFGGESYNQYTLQLKIIQPLYRGGALLSGLTAAQKQRDIYKRDLEITERDVTVQVVQAFYAVMLNQQLLDVLRATLQEELKSQAIAEKYYKIGRVQLIDLLQIKTQVALLDPKLSTAENQMKTSASQLMSLLHDSQTEQIHLQGDLVYLDPDRVTRFLSHKKELPELSRSRTQIEQFQDQTQVALAPYNPSFDFQALYGKTANSQSDLLNDFSNTWSVGFQLTVPIFAGLASVHEKSVLNSQEKQLQYSQEKLLDTIAYNQVQTERNLEVAATVFRGAKRASDYSIESLKEAQKGFKLSTINSIQLNTSQQNYLDAQTSFIQAKYNYIDAAAKSFVAAGIPISEFIQLLSDHSQEHSR